MLNVAHTLERMEISLTSPILAVQQVRDIIGTSDISKKAASLVKSVLSIDVKFDDDNIAVATTQAVIEAVVKSNGDISNEEELYAKAVARAQAYVNHPNNRWMYFYTKDVPAASLSTKNVGGTDVSVEVKANGKIKRGGYQVIADALFKKHVLESSTPCDNACFTKILITEAGMTPAGARTYAYNCRKAAGMVNK